MKKNQIIKYIVGAAAIIIVFSLWLVSCNSQKPVEPVLNVNPETLTGIQRGDAPWPPETSSLKKRLKEIGLPALTREGTVLHTHEHLDIFVAGRKVPVPSDIGINNAARFTAPIHTHDETGIIHVESPTSNTSPRPWPPRLSPCEILFWLEARVCGPSSPEAFQLPLWVVSP